MHKRQFLFISANQHQIPYPVYPLGISYLWSYLEKRLPDFHIQLLDLNLTDQMALPDILRKHDPDYIGISLRNVDDGDSTHQRSFIESYRNLIHIIRQNTNATIIIGGAGFSIYPRIFFQELSPDFGIYGEGEESLHRLVVALEQGTDYTDIDGLLYMRDGVLYENSRHQYSLDLSPSFSEQSIDYYWENSGMLNIQTKRGCPYHCIYCSYPIIEGRRVRTLNADSIVDTIEKLNKENKINYFFFTDSVFNLKGSFNRELAEKIIQRNLRIRWGAYFAPHNLDLDSLRLFKRSGLSHIEFGTESISDQTLHHYGKHFTVSDILQSSRNAEQAGIHYAHFLIFAGYGETNETIDETYENSRNIHNSIFFPYIGMRIYPQTRLQEYAIQEGVIDPEDDLLSPRFYISPHVDLSTLKSRSLSTGQKWVFPDEELPDEYQLIKKHGIKGPLWHLITRAPLLR